MRAGITVAFATRSYSPRIGRYIQHLKQSAGLSQIEFLVQINPGRQSLASVYNQFLVRARFDVVCLLHDDLRFERNSHWAAQVLQAFRGDDYAILSAAGSVSLDEMGVYWLPSTHMLGRVNHLLPQQKYLSDYSGVFLEPLPALVLDGLFLAVHRQRLAAGFDEALKGFHFYDIALSLMQSQAHQQGQAAACGVLTRLGISHASAGTPDRHYESARQAFLRRYHQCLPAYLQPELKLSPLPQRALPTELVIILWDSNPEMNLDSVWPDWPESPVFFFSPRPTSSVWPSNLTHIQISADAGWQSLNAHILSLLQNVTVQSVIFWETRVQALQSDLIPAMQQRLLQNPDLGSLGLRLHYADSHLLYCNGLGLLEAEGVYHIVQRGMHRPYAYSLKSEPVVANIASALMTDRQLFVDNGGFQGSDGVPGLFYGLKLAQLGYQHQVDSRWVAYWHNNDFEVSDPDAYQQFQQELQASLGHSTPASWRYLLKRQT